MSIKNIYWSRRVGEFVNKDTGEPVEARSFGNVSIQEWYHTLTLLISDFPRLTTIITSRDVNTILEHSPLYRPIYHPSQAREDVFLGPATLYGELAGKEVWIDEQMDSNILHVFYSKETFHRERVSIHIVGMDIF